MDVWSPTWFGSPSPDTKSCLDFAAPVPPRLPSAEVTGISYPLLTNTYHGCRGSDLISGSPPIRIQWRTDPSRDSMERFHEGESSSRFATERAAGRGATRRRTRG